ncbi:redoxin family protein [Thalassovita sp.]|jgi:peroxiredoxin|uniref:redoxin family protein n=1 Tax=Thalassovita sp. TaxID=1979401 RepID=UPI003B5B3957
MSANTSIPATPVQELVDGDVVQVDLNALSQGRKLLLIAVPGAFTPPCGEVHVPGYLAQADALKAKGADEILVVAPNDFFVMKAWSDQMNPDGKLRFLADGSGGFTKAMGQDLDLTDMGLGVRTERYAAVLSDGQITDLWVEPVATEVTISGAEAVLSHL